MLSAQLSVQGAAPSLYERIALFVAVLALDFVFVHTQLASPLKALQAEIDSRGRKLGHRDQASQMRNGLPSGAQLSTERQAE
jgi:hypothetical protein